MHPDANFPPRLFLLSRPTKSRRSLNRRQYRRRQWPFTKADRRNFFGIARGSVQECVPLLELADRQRLLQPEHHQLLKSQLEEIARMLSGLIKGLDKKPLPAPLNR